jgi:protein-L-isoaspartate(D-aspartate) O-methyltransferase
VTSAARAHRQRLVAHLRSGGHLATASVAAAFGEVAREHFVTRVLVRTGAEWRAYGPDDAGDPEAWLRMVYEDAPLVVTVDAHGQPDSTSTAPWLMADMLDLLALRPGDRLLEIGTGTGYNAALASWIVGERGRVSTIEVDRELAADAAGKLAALGMRQVIVHAGDGTLGVPEDAPFDAAIATAGCPRLPRAWVEQLAVGGRLVANVAGPLAGVVLHLTRSADGGAEGRFHGTSSTRFVPLRSDEHTGGPDPARLASLPQDGARSLSPADLQVLETVRTPDSEFRLWLQWHMPQLHSGSLRVGGPQPRGGPYLIDIATQTMFWVEGPDGTATIRGDLAIWDRILSLHANWEAAGRPGPASYEFLVRPPDDQLVICHGTDGRHEWSL